jgi:hypothetical protein
MVLSDGPLTIRAQAQFVFTTSTAGRLMTWAKALLNTTW